MVIHAQASPTAPWWRLQIGAMFNLANTDYYPEKFKGYGFYTTFDFTITSESRGVSSNQRS